MPGCADATGDLYAAETGASCMKEGCNLVVHLSRGQCLLEWCRTLAAWGPRKVGGAGGGGGNGKVTVHQQRGGVELRDEQEGGVGS